MDVLLIGYLLRFSGENLTPLFLPFLDSSILKTIDFVVKDEAGDGEEPPP